MPNFDLSKAKPPVDRNQQILDVLDPKDDGGSVPGPEVFMARDPELRTKAMVAEYGNRPAPKFDLTKAKPPTFNLAAAKPPAATPPQEAIAPPLPVNQPTPPDTHSLKESIAGLMDPAIKGAQQIESRIAAPFLSEAQKKILQDKGMYDPNSQPASGYAAMIGGPIGNAVIPPIMEALTKKADTAGKALGLSENTRSNIGSTANTVMDTLAVAGLPGRKGVAELPLAERTPLAIETKMKDLELKHDATTNPKEQAKIKEQMEALRQQHPETEEAARNAPKFDLSKAKPPETAAQGIKNIVAPEAADTKAEDTATTIRAETGTANRQTSKAEAKLEQSYKQADAMTPEQHADYYNYVEGRSKGETLKNPGLQKFADDTRDVMQNVRKEIEALPEGDKIGFYEDYFPHMWESPERARSFTSQFVAKQGSSANLKSRKLPTIADGIKAGLKLKDPNPVRAASRYATTMNNYIASKRIATQIIDKGDAKYYSPGKQPEGWVPLTGRFAERTRSYMGDETGGKKAQTEGSLAWTPPEPAAVALHEKLYAPPEVARVYNNFYSKGVEATDLAKPYELFRSANAANTAAELSLSAYHLGTITGQLLASDISRVLKNTLVGDWKGVAKAAYSATAGQIPFVKGSAYKLGKQMIGQYKGLKDHGIDMESIAEHFERGGGKVGQEKLYRGGEEGGFVTAKGGIKEATRSIKDKFNEPGLSGKAKAALEVFQRTTEDVSYPLFEKYIPSIKTGSFANLMGDWIRQHPEATDGQIAMARKHYVNLVDDRFGEMNMDNVFWHKYLKQVASVALRAQGWDIGLVRQAGGGVLDTVKILKDAFKGKLPDKKLLDRPAFLFSVIGTMALTSAAYQYMKTGKAPEEMLDLFAPKTGGTSTRGTPERTMLPFAAHGRELVHMAAPFMSEGALGTDSPLSGVTQEMSNKVASLPRNLVQAYENEDYAGNKIGDTTGSTGWAGSVPARVGHVLSGFAPFGLTEQGGKLKGSNLGGVERRLLGMRPAGMEIADPQNFRDMRWTQELKKEAKQHKSEARKEGQKE